MAGRNRGPAHELERHPCHRRPRRRPTSRRWRLGEALAPAQCDGAPRGGVSHAACRTNRLAYEPTVVAGVWAELLGRARARTPRPSANASKRGWQAVERRCELRNAEALSRDLGRVAAVHARYADVAVMTRPRWRRRGAARGDRRRRAVSFRPPGADRAAEMERRRASASAWWWPGTPAAKPRARFRKRARCSARPRAITVMTVDAKPKMFGHGDQPGANIAAHLSRRGLKAEVRNVDSMGRSASAGDPGRGQRAASRPRGHGRLRPLAPARTGVRRRHARTAAHRDRAAADGALAPDD